VRPESHLQVADDRGRNGVREDIQERNFMPILNAPLSIQEAVSKLGFWFKVAAGKRGTNPAEKGGRPKGNFERASKDFPSPCRYP